MTARTGHIPTERAFERMDTAIEALIDTLQNAGLLLPLPEEQEDSTMSPVVAGTPEEAVAKRVQYDVEELILLASRIKRSRTCRGRPHLRRPSR